MMNTKLLIIMALAIASVTQVYSQKDSTSNNRNCKLFVEFDVPITVLTGGISANAGIRHKNYRLSLGYEHFKAPSKQFSGTPDGFNMRVNYIYALNFDYFYAKSKSDKGFYSRLMYHNKSQFVENKASRDSKILYSQLVGLEAGYVWKFFHGLYVAPRAGALYYLKSPQGKDNNPVLIGDAFYDNKRHKVWDTYYSFMLGYSF